MIRTHGNTQGIARAVGAVVLAACLTGVAHGQSGYQLWGGIDGGGKTFSTGTGGWRLGGTIGEPDAGTLGGGSFQLRGGILVARTSQPTAVDSAEPTLEIGRLELETANPFHASARLAFRIDHSIPVRLEIFDLAGQRVRTLMDGTLHAGTYGVVWNGASDQGAPLPSGVYFARLRAGDRSSSRRLVLLD